MWLIALACLLGPMAWRSYCHYVDFYQWGQRQFSVWQLLPLALWFSYLIAVLILGPDVVKQMVAGGSRRGALAAFLYPGLGLALAAFPYSSSSAASHGGGSTPFDGASLSRVFGWFLVFVFALTVISRH